MKKAWYKKTVSLTLAALLTVTTGLTSISVKAFDNTSTTYLAEVVRTILNKAPALPNEVSIDGVSTAVIWDEIPQEALASGRRFWVSGTAESDKPVAMRVQVDAHKVLDNFEQSSANGSTVSGMIYWSGSSSSATPTPPTYTIEHSNVHTGLNSLKADFDFTQDNSGGTLSTYVNPGNLAFAAGEVPNSIGLWLYGNGLNYYKLRLLGKSSGSAITIDSTKGVAPMENGWHFYEFPIPESCKANGLTVNTLPGLVSLASANGAKVPGAFYLDDIVAIYGNETKDTTCLIETLGIANDYCEDLKADPQEISGLGTAIAAARDIMGNAVSTQQDIYDAEDLVVKAMASLRGSSRPEDSRTVTLEDFEGESGIAWEYATTNNSAGTVTVVTESAFVYDGTSAMKLSYQFEGTAGTALAAIKGSGYPNSKLTFTNENTPQQIGMWIYGKGQPVFALRLDIRKADKTGLINIPFISNSIIPEGWSYYTIDLAANGFTNETGVLFNYVPSVVATNDATKINNEIYVDDITLIYEGTTVVSGLKTASLLGEMARGRSVLIGAEEGEAGGQYPVGSLAELRLSIASAVAALSSDSQEQIDAKASWIREKINDFVSSLRPDVDKPALLARINEANELYNNAVEGDEPGQYILGSKAILKEAIDSAQAVYDDPATTSETVEAAKAAITNAIEEFEHSEVGPLQFGKLDEAIAYAAGLLETAGSGTNPGQYPQSAIDEFIAEVNKATNDRAACKTQNDINAVLDELKIAQERFDEAMVSFNYDKSALNEAIVEAEQFLNLIHPGVLGGQYPQDDYDIFKAAVIHAKKVLEDIRATEQAIADETTAISQALETIRERRIPAAWDEYNIPTEVPLNKRDMHGVWLSTVLNIDWPSKESLLITDDAERISTQKADLIEILDNLKGIGANTVFFQVRPASDAFYQSELAPWSIYLTGTLGKDPGFDPLQFAIEEAHRRGMELHAWCNPYRISMPAEFYQDENGNPMTSLDQVRNMLSAHGDSIYAEHPDWARVATNRLIIDPGIPDAIDYVVDCIMEIVSNYDVDGIHFDDYFYVGNNDGFDESGADQATYEQYGREEFDDINDWRRNNTYVLVKRIHDEIASTKPWVKFGISPAGVWRNKADDPLGSDTRAGIPNYDHGRSDTRRWVLEEIVDYICPQVYWSFNFNLTPYGVVSSWWADLLKNDPDCKTELYIGMAPYKLLGDGDPYWTTDEVGAEEIERQLKFNMANPDIDGSVLYNYGVLFTDSLNTNLVRERLTNVLWKTPVLVPSKYWANIGKASAPTISSAAASQDGVALIFDKTDENAHSYVIYRFTADETVDINNPENIIARYYPSIDITQNYLDTEGQAGDQYVITALNRAGEESEPSNVIIVY